MLTDFRIKNLALVDDLTIQFGPGYNAVTGETGAGKSIVIGALGLVLGERADRTLLRDGSEQCSVEAIIDVSSLDSEFHSALEENGVEPCEEGQLLLKRTFSSAGSNRQFVNGSPTSLSVLADVGEWGAGGLLGTGRGTGGWRDNKASYPFIAANVRCYYGAQADHGKWRSRNC